VATRKLTYRASANLTVTNLAGIASSAAWTSGWTSGTIDNTSDLDLDKLVSAKFTVESAGLAAGEIRLWCVPKLDDSTYPGGFDGTASAETTPLDDENGTLGGAVLLKVVTTDTTASQVYYMHAVSVAGAFNDCCPAKFVLFVTQSTGTTLETTGNQVTVKGTYRNIAQS
jgi:hypothetical protein